jgi:hypothetical protein
MINAKTKRFATVDIIKLVVEDSILKNKQAG